MEAGTCMPLAIGCTSDRKTSPSYFDCPTLVFRDIYLILPSWNLNREFLQRELRSKWRQWSQKHTSCMWIATSVPPLNVVMCFYLLLVPRIISLWSMPIFVALHGLCRRTRYGNYMLYCQSEWRNDCIRLPRLNECFHRTGNSFGREGKVACADGHTGRKTAVDLWRTGVGGL